MRVVCAGDCGIDLYAPSGERYFGGITANFARHARRVFAAGDEIDIVSCVGDDAGGDFVLRALEGSGIGCHIERRTGRTPVQYIEIEPDGEKRFVRYDEGVLAEWSPGDDQVAAISGAGLLVAPLFEQIRRLFDELMSVATAATVAIDFADFRQHPDFRLVERYVERLDIAFFGLSAADTKLIEGVRKLASDSGKLFIVTLGAAGSRAYNGPERVDCPAVPVACVADTTGAGDAYAAAFLAALCRGAPIAEAMREGAELAAGVVARVGAFAQ